ncbi:hypothetical protein CDA63_02755 [Hymenobacter amundsenii]|uniref:Tetrapyrrole biosynthesis glutamyl-tRNA reductase dimerisation domain-containing protein n=1 Tax=Hymenobacter amundsenii TaxID=2006685 RepID=A0A246FPN8_9BACT|nr:hypothetical protein [Hymenobacter amundsenii]OWP64697.1 hypothetical protein CDA63_02755 [Hymenobacter amundsenii]
MTPTNVNSAEWMGEQATASTIQRLTATLEQLRQEELRRFSKRLAPEEAASLDELTTALVQRVLQSMVGQIGAARQRGNSTPLLQVLSGLFDLNQAAAPVPTV